jgi:hypothetical protein
MKDEEILAYFDHRGRAELRTGRIGAPQLWTSRP